jgi:hypothetical protein
MPKRERTVTRVLERTQTHLIEPRHSRQHVFQWVSHKMPGLLAGPRAPVEVRSLARNILVRSRGVVVSSTMALSTAIVAMRGNGDFSNDSLELGLLQAVLRYSEQHQVPPRVVMELIAEDEEAAAALLPKPS